MECLLWVQRTTYCEDLSKLSSIKYLLYNKSCYKGSPLYTGRCDFRIPEQGIEKWLEMVLWCIVYVCLNDMSLWCFFFSQQFLRRFIDVTWTWASEIKLLNLMTHWFHATYSQNVIQYLGLKLMVAMASKHQFRRKTFMVHQTIVWWALYIL